LDGNPPRLAGGLYLTAAFFQEPTSLMAMTNPDPGGSASEESGPGVP
jgi:hypothetical protein